MDAVFITGIHVQSHPIKRRKWKSSMKLPLRKTWEVLNGGSKSPWRMQKERNKWFVVNSESNGARCDSPRWQLANRQQNRRVGTLTPNREDARRRFIMHWMHMHKCPLFRKFRSHLFNYWKKFTVHYFF